MSDSTLHYAGLMPRFLALAIDGVLFCLVFFPVTKLVKGVWLMSRSDHLWGYGWLVTDPLCIIFLVLMIIYFIVLEGTTGATLGKLCLGLRVVKIDGNKMDFMSSVIRNILRVVDALPTLNILGVWLILNSPENARFGDRVAGTRVVRK